MKKEDSQEVELEKVGHVRAPPEEVLPGTTLQEEDPCPNLGIGPGDHSLPI